MSTQIRRPKTAGSRFSSYRHKYPASTMEVEATQDISRADYDDYNPPSNTRSRSCAAVQTDFEPDYYPRTPYQHPTITAGVSTLRPMTAYYGSQNFNEPSVPNYQTFYQSLANDMARQKPNLNNRFYQEPGAPVFRSGRLGAPWRHIRQCTGNLGNHICFVDERPTEGNRHNQSRGRYGPSQNLVQTQGNTGSNIMHVNAHSNPIASNESPIQAGSFRDTHRTGRLGPYGHVVQVTGNLGNNFAFINPGPELKSAQGVVKQGDMNQFPPHGSLDTQLDTMAYISPRRSDSQMQRSAHPMMRSANYSSYTPRDSDMNRYKTSYNSRAKKGFKYWHEQIPYQGLPAKQTISGALMAKGIGC